MIKQEFMKTTYNARKEWAKRYSRDKQIAYPSEYVIRIFKGSYPTLNFNKNFNKKKICDLGCGDGRNFPLLHECGFSLYGTEITEQIIKKIKKNLSTFNIKPELKIGTNDKIPFQNHFFDFLLSWNSCYYMGKRLDFDSHAREMARIIKKNGYLILSIPKKTCFIYKGSKKIRVGYQIIKNDPFGIRNGEILRIFNDEKEIKKVFSKYFKNFLFASIHDNCFGYNYHWHIVVCQKK